MIKSSSYFGGRASVALVCGFFSQFFVVGALAGVESWGPPDWYKDTDSMVQSDGGPTPDAACNSYIDAWNTRFPGWSEDQYARFLRVESSTSSNAKPYDKYCIFYEHVWDQDAGIESIGAIRANWCAPDLTPSTSAPLQCLGEPEPDECAKSDSPVHFTTGSKSISEADFPSVGGEGLKFERNWQSQKKYWAFSYRQFITTSGQQRVVVQESGWVERFDQIFSNIWSPEGDGKGLLSNSFDGTWVYTKPSGDQEHFDYTSGQLVKIVKADGQTATITYPTATSMVVTDDYGNTIDVTLDAQNRVIAMIDPDGAEYRYAYNTEVEELEYVSYPDNTPGVSGSNPFGEDNPYRQYHYNDSTDSKLITQITDENGDVYKTIQYDTEGRAVLSGLSTGAIGQSDFDYSFIDDATDPRVTVTNSLNKDTVYHLQNHQDVMRVGQVEGVEQLSTGCLADVQSKEYYLDSGWLKRKIDKAGNETYYEYYLDVDQYGVPNERYGLISKRIEAKNTSEERTYTFDWFPTTRQKKQEILLGQIQADYIYHPNGRLHTQVETDLTGLANVSTRSWTYTYTYHNPGIDTQVATMTLDGPRSLPVSDTSVTEYSVLGYMTKFTNAMGHVTEYQNHNGRGQPGRIIDTNNVITDISYTPRGWLKTITRDVGGSDALTVIDYDDVGQRTGITLADGVHLSFEYDGAHRMIAAQNSLGERIEYTLDAEGNQDLVTYKDSGGVVKQTRDSDFDGLSRLSKELGSYGQETAYNYDDKDHLTTVTDGELNDTTFGYDALNRVASQKDPDNFDVLYSYDSQDRIKTVTDQRQLVTTFTYDGFGNLKTEQSPDTGTTTFEYDGAGNRTKKTDARSVVTDYAYDDLNRLTSVSYPATSSENVSHTYDSVASGNYGTGRLTGILDESGQIDFIYDARGNLKEKNYTVEAVSYGIGYGYDLADNLSQMVYPSGRIVDYVRDGAGRISAITTKEDSVASSVDVVTNITYMPFGPVKSYTYGNGISQTLSFDLDYRITGIDTSGLTSVLNLGYGYDNSNNIEILDNLDDSARNQDFQYDKENRLTQAVGSYGQLDYEYDGAGNRTKKTIADGSTIVEDYTYSNTSNQLNRVDIDDGSTQTVRTLNYDDNGNLIQDDRPTGETYEMGYNDANRYNVALKNSALPPRAEYFYNALGQRTTKVARGGNATVKDHYHYDESGMLLGITNETGVLKREYIYLAGTKVANLIDDSYANEWDGFDAPPSNNTSPTSNAGLDVVGLAGTPEQLDGSGSSDAEGPVTYLWSGPDLSDTTAVQPMVASVDLGSNISRVYNLTVTDTGGLSDGDSVNVMLYSMYADSDSDQLPDGWEFTHFGDISSYTGSDDPDSDGLVNAIEYSQGTDPNVPNSGGTDSDNDGIPDTSDNCVNDANPNQTDSDADTIGNVCDTEQFTVSSIATEDGWLRESTETSNIGNKTNSDATNKYAIRLGDNKTDKQYKGLVSFDLSGLPLGSNISDVQLKLRSFNSNGGAKGDVSAFGAGNMALKIGNFNDNPSLQNADFQAAATEASVGSIVHAKFAVGQINAVGVNAIQTGFSAGTTKIQIRIAFGLDDNDSQSNDYLGYYSSDNATASRHPKLVVDYQLPD